MRLLHVVPTYQPAWRYGGTIFAVHGLCRALAARGHDVEVFTTNVDGERVVDVPLRQRVTLDGVKVMYFPSLFRRLYWSPSMRTALASAMGSYDLVHLHAIYLWPEVAAARAARRAHVPYVISPRGMLVPELIRQKSRLAKAVWLELVERRNFARAAAIHFTSALEWRDAQRVGLPLPAPFVVPNGVETRPRPPIPRDERTLLCLGRVSWKKGIDRVIEVLPGLDNVRLLVAGNDDERLIPRLRGLAKRLGVAGRVEFLGPVYGAAKDEVLARATLFVLMSRSENFGNAVLEALAMETPVVVSPEVGIAEEVAGAGVGAVGLDALALLLKDPARRAEMGKKGRELVASRFGWPGVAIQMEDAYRCSIASRR